jgi:two-component system LytT family response regulator
VKPLRALVVDDERLARQELVRLLAVHPELEVVGEADDADAAAAAIAAAAPDVLFLDVQMPGGSGFDLLARVEGEFRTVFVTAYDEHALRAFEVNALDYLLKPVHPERLAGCVRKLVAAEGTGTAAPVGPTRRLEADDHLFVTAARRARFVRVAAIAALLGAGDYAELVTVDGERFLTATPLREWEERLPERLFARVHRSAIVNLAEVERVDATREESWALRVRGVGKPVPMSRRAASRLRVVLA